MSVKRGIRKIKKIMSALIRWTPFLEPFEEMFVLDTSGLNSGNYSVFVYGKSADFSLEILADPDAAGG